jgi:hypothetical protein
VRAVTFQKASRCDAVRRNRAGLGKEGADANSAEIAGNRIRGAPSKLHAAAEVTPLARKESLNMLHEVIPTSPSAESRVEGGPRSGWAYFPRQLLRRPQFDSQQFLDQLPEKTHFLPPQCMEGMSALEENEEKENEASIPGHSLFQEMFFFCTVKKFGDLPGPGCIYVETVVDRDSGVAFAKLYSSKNAMNAVDLLTSRVVPFFERKGGSIKEIHTRKTSEYFGLIPAHPFETFLATSHIQHLPMDLLGQPCNYLCEDFYRYLLKEFCLPALRSKFQLSLRELQKGLDAFVETYNAAQMKRENEVNCRPQPFSKFPC